MCLGRQEISRVVDTEHYFHDCGDLPEFTYSANTYQMPALC